MHFLNILEKISAAAAMIFKKPAATAMNFQKMCRCRAATAMEISDSSMEFFVP
jgi:hypothetical protein